MTKGLRHQLSIALIPEDKGVELLKFGHKLSHWPKERL